MTHADTTKLLYSSIEALDLSGDFKKMALLNGFRNLDELLSFSLSSLRKKRGFTPAVQQELVLWLFEHKLVEVLKQD